MVCLIFFYNNSNFLSLSIKHTLHPISRSFLYAHILQIEIQRQKKKKCGQKMSEKGNWEKDAEYPELGIWKASNRQEVKIGE